jgi:hypothetical protein
LALDVGRATVTQLDRRFDKRQVLKVPTPSDIGLRAGNDPTDRNARESAILSRTSRVDLLRVCH